MRVVTPNVSDQQSGSSLQRVVRLPVSRFTHGKSARRNMMADPLTPTDEGWLLNAGWAVVGYCDPAPYRDWKGAVERFYVGLMLQSPDGKDYWWHWMLARGPEALKDWRHSEWPVARQPNDQVERLPAKNL